MFGRKEMFFLENEWLSYFQVFGVGKQKILFQKHIYII